MTEAAMKPKGLDGVVVGETRLSRVDGVNGVLVYSGYHIDEVAKCSFEEICCLFLYGKLPNHSELKNFDSKLKQKRNIPEAVLTYIFQSPKNDHPMAVLRTAMSMLSGYLPKIDDMSKEALKNNAVALIAKVATVAAAIARSREGKQAIAPNNDLGHAANYLYMTTGEVPETVVAKTLDTALVLHADHGFNVSTFAARVVVSSLSDMLSGVTAAIGSLKGPLHGGANTAVMNMLLEIGEPENAAAWIKKALSEKRKVMGFGHRVYKTFDPRAKHLKRMSKEWGERVGEVKWFLMSEKIEELMKNEKNISANVDFYSATTYYSMGIKSEMFTVIFAVARMLGWTSHIMEQLEDNRLMRPKADYSGLENKIFEPIENRS